MGMPSDWTSYLDSGYRWNVQPGGTLTFSFYETGSTLYGSTPTGISEVPDAVKDNIRGIMSAMERFIAIDFVEVADSSSSYGTIRLDDAVFTALLTGTLSEDGFFIGTGAADGLDRIIYNDSTGALYYDADGIGATSAIQFGTVGTGLAMTAADFVVV